MQDAQLYMTLGTLTAELKALREQHERWRNENEAEAREVKLAFKEAVSKIDKIEDKMDSLIDWKPGVDRDISTMKIEQNQLKNILAKGMGMLVLMGTVLTLATTGVWQIIIHWADLNNAWKAFWGK